MNVKLFTNRLKPYKRLPVRNNIFLLKRKKRIDGAEVR